MIDWSEAGELFALERSVDRQAATLGGLHPVEMATAIRQLPLSRRRILAEALEDDRLADLLEEMPEDEQIRLVSELDPDRLARVLDEMEADDAADLLGEMSATMRAELLDAMDPEEAEPVRRLLKYEPDTAGGLMTPEPIILAATATVAQALARVRDPDLPVPLAAQVFVCQPPLETPTGRFIGVVGVQRLLREAPSKPVSRCIDEEWDPSEQTSATGRLPDGWPPTTSSRSPSPTRPAGLSERLRSTTSSIGSCRPTGGSTRRRCDDGSTRQPQQATRRPRQLGL